MRVHIEVASPDAFAVYLSPKNIKGSKNSPETSLLLPYAYLLPNRHPKLLFLFSRRPGYIPRTNCGILWARDMPFANGRHIPSDLKSFVMTKSSGE